MPRLPRSPMTLLRDRAGAALFERVAGPEGPGRRDRIHGSVGPRRFAPDSAIVRVHADASMFIGGLRALMLQSLHPVAMTAVAEHSGYRGDMWGRLARTSTFLAETTFATDEDAAESVALVRRIHGSIRGTMPDGTPYRADDPHLLAWVHVAEISSFLVAHQVYGSEPLDQAGRDEYVEQTGVVAAELGVLDPPTTEAELEATLASYRAELRGSRHARDAISFLLWTPPLPLVARPAYWTLVTAAIGLMPPWTRAELGLPSNSAAERTLVPVVGAAATATIRWAMGGPPDRSVADVALTSPTAHATEPSRQPA